MASHAPRIPSSRLLPLTPAPPARSNRGLSVELLRGSLLLALGGMLVFKVANGTIAYYIKADLAWGVLLAAVALAAVGAAYLLRWAVIRPPAGRWRSGLAETVLLVPLLAGLALPVRPLDSAALETRGLNTYAATSATDARLAALQTDTTRWTLLDWRSALQREANPAVLRGKPVSVVGFVYDGDHTLQPGEFSLVRFVVTCCAADGAAVGLPVRWQAESAFARDAWLEVDGALDIVTGQGGESRAVIAATSVKPVAVPAHPYLYP